MSCNTAKWSTTKTMDVNGAGIIQMPVLADLDIKDIKVSGSARALEMPLENIKNNAVNDALIKANADVLVEPKFVIEKSTQGTIVTVTGYPATYKNFRNIKVEDIPLLQLGAKQKAKVYEPTEQK